MGLHEKFSGFIFHRMQRVLHPLPRTEWKALADN